MIILKLLRNFTCIVLLICLVVCGYLLWSSSSDTREQSRFQDSIACYKPEAESVVTSNLSKANQKILYLQTKYPDVLGWLTLDNTAIDYPFVQSMDNEDYLRTDLDGNYLKAGTVFADFRCDISTSFMTILYGHNLLDGSMYGDICKFADGEFWEENTSGMLFLPYETYQLQAIAYLVVNASDSEIYAPYIHTESEVEDFQNYLVSNALNYRPADLTANDRILVLSTCNYEYTGARSVLVVKAVSGR